MYSLTNATGEFLKGCKFGTCNLNFSTEGLLVPWSLEEMKQQQHQCPQRHLSELMCFPNNLKDTIFTLLSNAILTLNIQ
jgi:hypothetical protein